MTLAIEQWRRHYRGETPVIDDSALTDKEIANKNLVLWGDPSSNQLLGRVADKLPIRWIAEKIKVGDKTYDAASHAPALIYPNPLNPARYIVRGWATAKGRRQAEKIRGVRFFSDPGVAQT